MGGNYLAQVSERPESILEGTTLRLQEPTSLLEFSTPPSDEVAASTLMTLTPLPDQSSRPWTSLTLSSRPTLRLFFFFEKREGNTQHGVPISLR